MSDKPNIVVSLYGEVYTVDELRKAMKPSKQHGITIDDVLFPESATSGREALRMVINANQCAYRAFDDHEADEARMLMVAKVACDTYEESLSRGKGGIEAFEDACRVAAIAKDAFQNHIANLIQDMLEELDDEREHHDEARDMSHV